MLVCKVRDPMAIKLLLAKTGKSLRGFSKDIGVSHPYLSQILNGKRNPSAVIAHKISKAFDKEINDLFVVKSRGKVKV